jgi:hypothetical protein
MSTFWHIALPFHNANLAIILIEVLSKPMGLVLCTGSIILKGVTRER